MLGEFYGGALSVGTFYFDKISKPLKVQPWKISKEKVVCANLDCAVHGG
jgi:hypothetical protein